MGQMAGIESLWSSAIERQRSWLEAPPGRILPKSQNFTEDRQAAASCLLPDSEELGVEAVI